MKVYIAFDGDYSARSVTAVFTDKEKADECSRDVEEHELDQLAGYTMHDVWEVRLRIDNGALISSSKSKLFEVPNYCRTQRISDWRGGSIFSGYSVDTATMGISSTSQDHALKLAAEDRQSYLRECALVPKPGLNRTT